MTLREERNRALIKKIDDFAAEMIAYIEATEKETAFHEKCASDMAAELDKRDQGARKDAA